MELFTIGGFEPPGNLPLIMKLVSSLAVALVAGLCLAQTPAKAVEKIFDPARNPNEDLAKAMKQAAKENKRILMDVGGNWCSWCHKLDKMFKTDEDVKKTLVAKYVILKVNFSPDNENKEFLAKYPKITGYPHLFVLDAKGKLLHSQDTGLLETGANHDHDKVMTFLNKWAVPTK